MGLFEKDIMEISGDISFDSEKTKKMISNNDFLTNQYLLIRFREWKKVQEYPSDEEILRLVFEEHIKTNELMVKQYGELT